MSTHLQVVASGALVEAGLEALPPKTIRGRDGMEHVIMGGPILHQAPNGKILSIGPDGVARIQKEETSETSE